MVTLAASFRTESQRIHNEHQAMEHLLVKLDAGLDRLVCYSEVYANLATAGEVATLGRQLVGEFSDHCQREEVSLLNPVSEVSPELREFCSQKKLEHQALRMRLDVFRHALEDFESEACDLYEAICHLKDLGQDLTRELRRHVDSEEQELSGFL